MDTFNEGVKILYQCVLAFGGLIIAWGVIQVGLGYKDHASPQIQQGIGWLIGGAMICLAGGIIAGISIAS